MAKNIIEKIFSDHTTGKVKPGEIIWLNLDVVTARDFGGPNVVRNFNKFYQQKNVFDSKKVYFTFDLTVPPKTIQYANNQQSCREFAQKKGIKVFDVDQGIGTHILMEKGLALPGEIVVGTDSHMNILGAVNCFGQGMGDIDITFAFRYGKTWFEVPETVKVIIEGNPIKNFSAKDLTLKILSVIKSEGLLGKAVEFYGNHIEKLSLSGRITLLSMITEMGGIIGFIPFNDKVSEEINVMNKYHIEAQQIKADEDADYSKIVRIDISDIESMVAVPPYPHNVKKVSEIGKIKIDFGFIGSCTNGRIEDLEKAWEILKGKSIANGVRLAIVPATRKIFQEALQKGIIQDLFESGAVISNPGCGGCAQGHIGMTGKNEVMVSTGNRNFPGKQGDGLNYLTSPEVVANSVLRGYISSGDSQ